MSIDRVVLILNFVFRVVTRFVFPANLRKIGEAFFFFCVRDRRMSTIRARMGYDKKNNFCLNIFFERNVIEADIVSFYKLFLMEKWKFLRENRVKFIK